MLNSVLQKETYEGVLGNRSKTRSGSRSSSRDVRGKIGGKQRPSREIQDKRQVDVAQHKKKLQMSNGNHGGSVDWSKDPDRLCFKRKSTTRPAAKSPIEDSHQGFNGSRDQIQLTNQRTTESTIR